MHHYYMYQNKNIKNTTNTLESKKQQYISNLPVFNGITQSSV